METKGNYLEMQVMLEKEAAEGKVISGSVAGVLKRIPWNKGKKASPEATEKMRQRILTQYKNGRIPHNKGKTKENYLPLAIVSQKVKEYIEENGTWDEGLNRPDHAVLMKKWYENHETTSTKRLPEVTAKINSNPNYIESRKCLGVRNKLKKYREISRKSANEHFSDLEWKEKIWLPKFIEAKEQRPSKYEMEIKAIICELSLPFKYVGDWSLWIGGKNPDFISTDERKIIIEVASKKDKDYRFGSWKKYAKNRRAYFKKFKYETEFIWQEEKRYFEKLKEICAKHGINLKIKSAEINYAHSLTENVSMGGG